VFGVVQGARTAVETILAHPDIAAISFVGSTAIAELIYKTGTSHGKRVQALGLTEKTVFTGFLSAQRQGRGTVFHITGFAE